MPKERTAARHEAENNEVHRLFTSTPDDLYFSMDPIILPISRSKEIFAHCVSIKDHACNVLLNLLCLKELMLLSR